MESDKEFDQLFQSKLNDLEAVPSDGIWLGIEDELNVRKRKMKIVPFLGIAASLLILISAGLLFIPHQTKTIGKHLLQNKISKAKQPLNRADAANNTYKHVPKYKTGKTLSQQIIAVDKIRKPRSVTSETDNVKRPESSRSDSPLVTTSQQKTREIINPVSIAKVILLPVEQPAHENIDVRPIVAAVSMPAGDQPFAEMIKPKHKIKSFGDLVNVVVAKVDKRKDKLIEFTDVDDDESTITGINLGVLKIKKDK